MVVAEYLIERELDVAGTASGNAGEAEPPAAAPEDEGSEDSVTFQELQWISPDSAYRQRPANQLRSPRRGCPSAKA